MAELRGLLAGIISTAVGIAAAAVVLIWVSATRGGTYSRLGWRTDLMEGWRWSEIAVGALLGGMIFALYVLLIRVIY